MNSQHAPFDTSLGPRIFSGKDIKLPGRHHTNSSCSKTHRRFILHYLCQHPRFIKSSNGRSLLSIYITENATHSTIKRDNNALIRVKAALHVVHTLFRALLCDKRRMLITDSRARCVLAYGLYHTFFSQSHVHHNQ